ncbi:MAG: HAD-IA family hydrolase [Elusimicrobiota bacterium]
METGKFKLLIFDLDGTLIDSQKDLADSVNYVLSCYGKPSVDTVTLRSYIGNGVVSLMERALPFFKGEQLHEAVAVFREHYGQHLLDTTRPYGGIEELLKSSPGVKKAVLTNKPEIFSKKILEGLNLSDCFSLIWGGDTGRSKKPSPEPVLEIIKSLGADLPETILIGDGINDILAAKAAKILSGAVGYGYTDAKELALLKPDYFFRIPADLMLLIENK